MAFQEITSPPMLDSTAQDMVSVLRQIYSKYDVEKSTLREVPFGVGVNDWVASDDVYVATVSSAYVTTTSKEFTTFTKTLRTSAKGDISVDKIHGGGGITLTTNVLPTGTINGTLYVIDADDGKVPILIEDTVVPVSNGGTGESTVAGAQDVLGITALNDKIGSGTLPTTAQTLTGAIAEQNDNIAMLQNELGIVCNGNKCAVSATTGQYIILKNSTISGCADGLYTATQAIPANTAITSAYLSAVSNGGLNTLNDRFAWKLAGQTTGKNSISLPATFEELIVYISNGIWVNFTLDILRNELTGTNKYFSAGSFFSNTSYNSCLLMCSTSAISLDTMISSGENVSASAEIRVYYH